MRIRLDVLEAKLLPEVRTALLSSENVEKFKREIIAGLRRPDPNQARRAKLDGEIQQLVDAVATGVRSRAVIERLQTAELERDGLASSTSLADRVAVWELLPRAIELYRQKVVSLGEALAESDIERARSELKDAVGEIRIVTDEAGGAVAEIGLNPACAVVLTGTGVPIGVVAGARYALLLQSHRARGSSNEARFYTHYPRNAALLFVGISGSGEVV